ncbi:putative cobaltochelatase [Desulfovirgula thermocuniculi]|uniref:putative cobaltochelatase n=1 Tax=Desulfovirgula thermocuniculi TaxID=348842 RepID=UPI001FDFC05E|nr:putative cobaltochelatase [Desulfovirgula thermocuniculi]
MVYPFTAIVGQEKMKKALILNIINPRLGGVLIRGEKGTCKSTAVRALAALLPEIEVVAGCPFNCDPDDRVRLCPSCRQQLTANGKLPRARRRVPVVDLPVSATEDRVVGCLDFEYALRYGKPRFEPGILARANRGILYIDEVNLLDDHLVDVLLDAAATGVNIVEREGISYAHPAEFSLVGTMNPEEGELRPQLLDRFGLCVQVEGVEDPRQRVEIMRRREAFDADPLGFISRWAKAESELARQIAVARSLLTRVIIPERLMRLAVDLAMEALVAGHRAEVVLVAAARTLAAFAGRGEVAADDVLEAAELVLIHRARQAPPPPQQLEEDQEEPPKEGEEVEEKAQTREEETQHVPPEHKEPQEVEGKEGSSGKEELNERSSFPGAPQETVFAVGRPFAVRRIALRRDRILRKGSGRRSRTKTASRCGRYVRSTMHRQNNDLAFDATLRAAAPYQVHREKNGLAVAIEPSDIREKVREKRIGNFLLFVVDASGSMGAQQRMVETKGAILSLLLDAYQKRDKIGMIAFRGHSAEVLLPPTNSVEMGHRLLKELPTGGRTPLSAGLLKAYEVAKTHLRKDPHISPLIILVSDGRANVSMGEDKPLAEALRVAELIRDEERIKSIVVDVEKEGFFAFGLARRLAFALGADYYKIDDLKAEALVQAVREIIP